MLVPLLALAVAIASHAPHHAPRPSYVGRIRCPPKRATCFALHVHVVEVNGRPAQRPKQVRGFVKDANRLFAPLNVGFEIVHADALARDTADIVTRRDRDELGFRRYSDGVVHVFAVGDLADVDIPGAFIRGVHWRHRKQRRRRWIIISNAAQPLVLAHELGPFFRPAPRGPS